MCEKVAFGMIATFFYLEIVYTFIVLTNPDRLQEESGSQCMV